MLIAEDADKLLRYMDRFEVVGYTDNSSLVKVWMVRDNRSGAFTNVVPFSDIEAARKCWALAICMAFQNDDRSACQELRDD